MAWTASSPLGPSTWARVRIGSVPPRGAGKRIGPRLVLGIQLINRLVGIGVEGWRSPKLVGSAVGLRAERRLVVKRGPD